MKYEKVMEKIFEAGNKNDHAMVGIGTLVVFIAMVMVAAVAASVLIQTSETVSGMAKKVVKETTNEIANGIWVRDIYGYTNEEKTQIEYVGITIKPHPGSDAIDMSDIKLVIERDEINILSYDADTETVASVNKTENVFDEINLGNLTKLNFGIVGIIDKDYSVLNELGLGPNDEAMLIVNTSAVFDGNIPRDGFNLEIMMPYGTPKICEVAFPMKMSYRVVDLTK